MAEYYKPPKPTGGEFETDTRQLHKYAIHMLMKAPKRFDTFLVEPASKTIHKAYGDVINANRIYISPEHQAQDELISAYNQRDQLLYEAIRYIEVFDQSMKDIMDEVDLMKADVARMRSILNRIVKPDTPNLKVDVKWDQMQFTTVIGNETMKLGITPKQYNTVLNYERQALKSIRKRIAMDKAALKKLATI